MDGRKRVLIADDEANIVTALQFLLAQGGYEVQVARNGEQALERVAAWHPHLVLLDVMMPLRSGYEVCRRIRERPEWQDIKVIVLSAKGRAGEVEKGLEAGPTLYVVKPFSTRDLMEKIGALLAGA